MQRMGIDPALAGSVVLTTVTDVVGFFAFLSGQPVAGVTISVVNRVGLNPLPPQKEPNVLPSTTTVTSASTGMSTTATTKMSP